MQKVITPSVLYVCVWIRTAGGSHPVPLTHSHSHAYMQTDIMALIFITEFFLAKLDHTHTQIYADFISDIQHGTGPLFKLIDQIQCRLANIGKQS